MNLLMPIFLFLIFLIIFLRALEYFREKRGRIVITTESEQSEPQKTQRITSKIKAIDFYSIIFNIMVIAIIILVIGIIISVVTLIKVSSVEDFSDNNTFKDYYYQGEYIIDDEVLKIFGNATIINKDTGCNLLGIWYFPSENSEFSFLVGGKGTINITMKNGYDEFKFQTVDVSSTRKIKFGTSLVPAKRGKLWLKTGRSYVSPNRYFNTGEKYSIEIEAKGLIWIDKLYIGR